MPRDFYTSVPYIHGAKSILRRLVLDAASSVQRIAYIGDSQETSPGSDSAAFIHRLNALSWYYLGVPSETMAFFPVSSAQSFLGRTSVAEFVGNHPGSPVALPSSPVKAQSATTYGFLTLLDKRGTFSTGVTIATDKENWFEWSDLRAEFYLLNNSAGPDGLRVRSLPTNTNVGSYFATVTQTFTSADQGLTDDDSTWQTYTTTQITDSETNTFPQVILQGWNGSAVTNGLTCGGMRFKDHGRNSGVVWQSFAAGGASAASWVSTYSTSYGQFVALGPWNYVAISLGTNDMSSVDDDGFKTNMQALIDMVRSANWGHQSVPIILIAEPPRTDAGGSYDFDAFKRHAAVYMELADENDDTVAINGTRILEDAGYDASDSVWSGDGSHLTQFGSGVRADTLMRQILKTAVSTRGMKVL